MSRVWVIGSGGHAKVVIDAFRAMHGSDVAGVLDDNSERWGAEVLGARVVAALTEESIVRLNIERAVIAIGSSRIRAGIVSRFSGRLTWPIIIHPTAHLATSVRIGEGSVVLAGAVAQPDATIGPHSIISTSCSVDHDNVIGAFVHIGPGSHLGGNVRIEEGAFLGVGVSVIPGRTIGAWATIGAGAVVVHDIPQNVTAKGVPARFESPT